MKSAYRLPILLLACLPLACGGKQRAPNVLFVTIDTLRADRLGPATPALLELAAQGSRLDAAIAPRAKTAPSVATLLSALPPHAHGVRDLLSPLPDELPLVQETLRAHGWRTGAIVGNFVLKDEHSGFARGFDLWVEDLPQQGGVPPHDVPQRTAASLVDGALAALGLGAPVPDAGPRSRLAPDGKPWFLWLHLMDPHGAYEPPEEHRRPAAAARPIASDDPAHPARHVAEYNAPASTRLADGRIDAAAVEALYDGEVRYADAQLGRLFERLREAGLWDDTLVVVTADHGESFGEEDVWFEHGRDASEATVRVPLVAKLPRNSQWRFAKAEARGEARLADIAPTLLEWLALPPFAASDEPDAGRSVAAEWCAGAVAPRPVGCEKIERTSLAGAVQTKVVRLWPWRLERRLARDETGALRTVRETLARLDADPRGETDLLPHAPPEAPLELLRAELERRIAADTGLARLDELLERKRADLRRLRPGDLRAIEALGY